MGFGGSTGGSATLSGANDVALNNVLNSQQLQYDTTTDKWTNGAVASRLIETINTVPSSGETLVIPDVDVATITLTTLTSNCTLTFPDASLGKKFSVCITYDQTPHTVTWPASVRWPNDTPPTLTGVSGRQDLFTFTCLSNSGLWMGAAAGQNYSTI